MVFHNNLVAAVKSGGKVLREKGDSVFLPFGSQYNVLLKNLGVHRAVVSVNIDGKPVIGDGMSLILNPNSEHELKGFIEGTRTTNRFKFIEKTDRIRKHRGDRIDDGFIRINFKYELPMHTQILDTPLVGEPTYWSTYNSYTTNCCDTGSNIRDTKSSSGITVPGAPVKVNYSVGSTSNNFSEPSVIVIHLKGIRQNKVEVPKPVFVNTKFVCPTCGIKNKSINKYCRECGTCLI